MKARTNVSIDREILEAARSRNIVLSAVLEEAVKKKLTELAEAEWKSENDEEISAYNSQIQTNGVFSDEMRTF